VAQTSGVDGDESWGWPCPYCRAHNPVEALACANCGSQLRDPDDDDLFTTVAADNAEVVPPDAPFGRDNMWTTDANGAEDVDIDDAEVVDDDLWDPAPAADWPVGPAGFGFSAEPAARPSDVIDEPYLVDERANGHPRATGNLFSSSSSAASAPASGSDRGPCAAPAGAAAPEPDPWIAQDRWPGAANGVPPGWPAAASAPVNPPPVAPPGPYGQPGPVGAPQPAPPTAPPPGYDPAAVAAVGQWQYTPPAPPPPNGHAEPHHAPVADAHGLSAAVGRLRLEDQERAAVPISVCGALLQHDEVVLAAVTGQMLGHAAVVVLTNRRVLVVNGRRWQPIVDVFEVGPSLMVRGRHDRDVAALTFSDETRLSTVDGISEVGLAVELAERIRGE
jgi:hypothetical protein